MSYISKMLLPDEKVYHIATIHWVVFLPGFCLAFLGGVLGVFCHELASLVLEETFALVLGKILAGIGMLFALVGFGLLVGAMVRQSSTELAITNRRVIAKYGFIARATFELMIDRITGVNFDQTVTGRLLGYGTILVHGTGGDISPFEGISNPQIFQHILMKVLDRRKKNI
ncbi:MAG: PH domain-containing protein [Alphaproteobacteria bacterium]|nr:PH domain-containing protein [Alphaproteobacteria bacterium]